MATQGKGLLAVWTDIPEHIEADFNRWYDEEHLPERAGIPGFLNARRYLSLQSTPKYLALYDTVDAQVLQSDPLPQGPGQFDPLDTAHPPALSEFCAQRV